MFVCWTNPYFYFNSLVDWHNRGTSLAPFEDPTSGGNLLQRSRTPIVKLIIVDTCLVCISPLFWYFHLATINTLFFLEASKWCPNFLRGWSSYQINTYHFHIESLNNIFFWFKGLSFHQIDTLFFLSCKNLILPPAVKHY